jgi:hypothetical protein
VVVVVVALLTGVGLMAAFGAIRGSGDASTSARIDADVDPAVEPAPLVADDRAIAPGAPAASPRAAVEQFLAAEVARDFDTSYGLLAEVQRASHGSAAAWRNAHADFFPVTGFEIIGAEGQTVTADVRYRSSLDEVVGLVPARATVEWPTLEEGGGWVVDFDAARLEPVYPDDAGAVEAALEWAAALRACGEPLQYDGALVATADLRRLAQSLCDQDTPVTVEGPAQPLDEFAAAPFVSAFGTAALSWGRSVDLSGPVELTVVLAPIEDRWVVVGLLPST